MTTRLLPCLGPATFAFIALALFGCGPQPSTGGGQANNDPSTNNTPDPEGDCTPEDALGEVCHVGEAELVVDLLSGEPESVNASLTTGASLDPGLVVGGALVFKGTTARVLYATNGEETRELGGPADSDLVGVFGDTLLVRGDDGTLASTDGQQLTVLPVDIPDFDEYPHRSIAVFNDGALLGTKATVNEGGVVRNISSVVRTDGTTVEIAPFTQMTSVRQAVDLSDGSWALIGDDPEGLSRLWVLDSAFGTPRQIEVGSLRIKRICGLYSARLLIESAFDGYFMVDPSSGMVTRSLGDNISILNATTSASHLYYTTALRKLVATDGTEEGTVEFADHQGFASSQVRIADVSLVTLKDGDEYELHALRPDGTQELLLKRLETANIDATVFGDRLVFKLLTSLGVDPAPRAWVTDGTAAGTHQICTEENCSAWTEVGGELWIRAEAEDSRGIRITRIKALGPNATELTTRFDQEDWVGERATELHMISKTAGPEGGIFVRLSVGADRFALAWTDGEGVEPLPGLSTTQLNGTAIAPVFFDDAWYLIADDGTSGPELWRWTR